MGWIKIDKRITDHWIWSDDKKLKWWLTILMEVNYADGRMALGYEVVEVRRGQSSKSIRCWAETFRTSTKVVLNFFKMLENDGMISRETIGKGKQSTTLLTVCKYDSYQGQSDDEETQEKRNGARKGKREGIREGIREGCTIEEGKERKENKEGKKEVNNIPLIDEVISFFVDNGYRQDVAEQAYRHYNRSTPPGSKYWADSKGNSVKNWKQKMRVVWFRDEHKASVDAAVHLPAGWRFVGKEEAYEIVREAYPVSLQERMLDGRADEYVERMMDMNPSYSREGTGWKVRSKKP